MTSSSWARPPIGHIGLGPDCVYYDVKDKDGPNTLKDDMLQPPSVGPSEVSIKGLTGCIFKYTFEGSNPVEIRGEDELPHYTNYFIGNDPSGWVTNVKCYGRVVYENLREDIDMVFYFGEEGPKYDMSIGTKACVDDI